jgi:hypothetical protein
METGEGFKLFDDTNYFGINQDRIIFQMRDRNSINGSTDGGFVFQGYTPTDNISKGWMVIKSDGKLGIGTTNPFSKFTVAGTLSTSTSQLSIVNS